MQMAPPGGASQLRPQTATAGALVFRGEEIELAGWRRAARQQQRCWWSRSPPGSRHGAVARAWPVRAGPARRRCASGLAGSSEPVAAMRDRFDLACRVRAAATMAFHTALRVTASSAASAAPDTKRGAPLLGGARAGQPLQHAAWPAASRRVPAARQRYLGQHAAHAAAAEPLDHRDRRDQWRAPAPRSRRALRIDRASAARMRTSPVAVPPAAGTSSMLPAKLCSCASSSSSSVATGRSAGARPALRAALGCDPFEAHTGDGRADPQQHVGVIHGHAVRRWPHRTDTARSPSAAPIRAAALVGARRTAGIGDARAMIEHEAARALEEAAAAFFDAESRCAAARRNPSCCLHRIDHRFAPFGTAHRIVHGIQHHGAIGVEAHPVVGEHGIGL